MKRIMIQAIVASLLAHSAVASTPMSILSGRTTRKSMGIFAPVAATGSFVQKVKTPKGKTIEYEGKLAINRTREFKMQYLRPTRRDLCGDSSSVAIIDHYLEQVNFFKVGSLLDLMQILKRAEHHHADIYVSKYHGIEYTLKLDKSGKLEQVAFVDDMENTVNIHFYGMKYKKTPLPRMELECPIPKNYDIIDK